MVAPNACPGPPGIDDPEDPSHGPFQAIAIKAAGITSFITLRFDPAIPASDRQSFYGSFTRDIVTNTSSPLPTLDVPAHYFDSALAATPFTVDPFGKRMATPQHERVSLPIQSPVDPFTVAGATLMSMVGLCR